MIPNRTTLAIKGFTDPSDIRFVVLKYQPEVQAYLLGTTLNKHTFMVDALILHAQVRTKQLLIERTQA